MCRGERRKWRPVSHVRKPHEVPKRRRGRQGPAWTGLEFVGLTGGTTDSRTQRCPRFVAGPCRLLAGTKNGGVTEGTMEMVVTHGASWDIHNALIVATVFMPGTTEMRSLGTLRDERLVLGGWPTAAGAAPVAMEAVGVCENPILQRPRAEFRAVQATVGRGGGPLPSLRGVSRSPDPGRRAPRPGCGPLRPTRPRRRGAARSPAAGGVGISRDR